MTYPEGFEPPAPPVVPGAPRQAADTIRVQDAATPLFEAKGWMKLFAVLAIIGGALQALTIVGILFAWLPIWMGVLLWQSADAADKAHASGNAEQFMVSQKKLKTMFTVYGIVTIIGLIIGVVVLLIFGAAMFSAIQNDFQGFST